MKKLFIFICTLYLIFMMGGTAGAVNFTETLFLSNPAWIIGNDYTYDHNLNGLSDADYTIDTANLEIAVASYYPPSQVINFEINGIVYSTGSVIDIDLLSSPAHIADILNGSLTVAASSSSPGLSLFILERSTLTVDATATAPTTAHSPIPPAIILLGSGMIGLLVLKHGHNRRRG